MKDPEPKIGKILKIERLGHFQVGFFSKTGKFPLSLAKALDTPSRQKPSKFVFALAYSYLCVRHIDKHGKCKFIPVGRT